MAQTTWLCREHCPLASPNAQVEKSSDNFLRVIIVKNGQVTVSVENNQTLGKEGIPLDRTTESLVCDEFIENYQNANRNGLVRNHGGSMTCGVINSRIWMSSTNIREQ